MSVIEKIEQEILDVVKSFGCEIVNILLFGSGVGKTLQIMIERSDFSSATIDDCEKISKVVAVHLDVLDVISGKYNLEISSAGLDRPLIKKADFVRFCGSSVIVKTYEAKNDRKIFKGILKSASENSIKLNLESQLSDGAFAIEIEYEEISKAHIDSDKI